MSPADDSEALREAACRLVLDDLGADERRALEAEAAADPRLGAEVTRLRAALDLLPHAAATHPPARLRARVLETAARRRTTPAAKAPVSRSWVARRRRPAWGTLAAIAASLVAAVLAWDGLRLRRELALNRDVAALLLEPNVVLSFQLAGTGEGSGSFGAVSLDLDDEKGAIAIRDLPPLGADRVYALWARVADADVPCGQFRVDPKGNALAQFAVPVDSYTAPVAQLFVTVEPKSVPDKPTGPRVMESV